MANNTGKERPGEISPDPLEQAEAGIREPMRQCYLLVTEGRDPSIDALGVICQVLEPLNEDERAAVLAYVTSRFAGPQ